MSATTVLAPPTPATPTGKLARSWLILVPMLYYANSGRLAMAETNTAADVGLAHQIGLLVVCLICSTLIFNKLAVVLTSSLQLKMIVFLPVLAVLSTAWSVDPSRSIVSAATLLCFTAFAIYIAETFSSNAELDLIMLTGAVAVPLSILLALLLPAIGATSSGWRGIFAHKQQCAAATTFFVISAIHWKPRLPSQKPLRILFVLLCFLLIIMSQSRTGWLLTLIALTLSLILWLLQKTAPKDGLFAILMAIPITAGLVYLFTLFASVILASAGKDPTLSQRTVIWGAVWESIAKRPLLGYGYEAFWQGLAGESKNVVMVSGWNIAQAQSGYLDLWVQLGFLGVLTLIFMTGQAALDAVRTFRHATNGAFVRWSIVVLICNLIYNIGESDFSSLRILWFLFLIACIGLRKEASMRSQFTASERIEQQGLVHAHTSAT